MADPAQRVGTAGKAGARAGVPPAAPPNALSTALRAFWEGFSTPSALAFRVFCLALAATCAFSLWFFSETTLAGPLGQYLPRSGRDAEAFATHEALRSGHSTPDRPRILILGTSTLAQAIGPGKALHDALLAETGQDWEIVNLTTPLQAPSDQFALAERALDSQAAGSPPVIVVLGFGLQRLRWTAARTLEMAAMPRLGLRSAWADAEVTALGGMPPPRSGVYLRDNLAFVLINGSEALLRLALQAPAKRRIDSYAESGAHGPRSEARRIMGADIRAGLPQLAPLQAQIERLAGRLAGRPGTRLVLIEEPLSPALLADQDLAGPQADFVAAMAGFSVRTAIPYWPLGSTSGLAAADFYDDLHVLRGAAQERFQAALAARLGGLIAAEAAGAGQGGAGDGG
jgi:hypothetical protein